MEPLNDRLENQHSDIATMRSKRKSFDLQLEKLEREKEMEENKMWLRIFGRRESFNEEVNNEMEGELQSENSSDADGSDVEESVSENENSPEDSDYEASDSKESDSDESGTEGRKGLRNGKKITWGRRRGPGHSQR